MGSRKNIFRTYFSKNRIKDEIIERPRVLYYKLYNYSYNSSEYEENCSSRSSRPELSNVSNRTKSMECKDLETRSQSQKLRSNIQRKIGNSVAPSGYFIRVLVYFIYLAIGAYVFLCLERQNEIELCQAAKNISTLYMKGLPKGWCGYN